MRDWKAWIAGCSGLALTDDERRFFADERPFGFILFRRNIESAEQVRDLVAELKEIGGRATTPILVDQEGGRVQRLRPPLAPRYPPSAVIGLIHADDDAAGRRAAWLHGRLHAHDIMSHGINVDCIPCLDLRIEGANAVIGDRAYAGDADSIAALGRAAAEGLAAGGALPVMKHIPGHGRTDADSHLDLPVVATSLAELRQSDFRPFVALAHLPAAMSAHLLFTDIDASLPATLSPIVVSQIIRQEIGFHGLLMSDDISMKALRGDIGELSAKAIAAGMDLVLHCNGEMEEMLKVSAAVPELTGRAKSRAQVAEGCIDDSAHTGDVTGMRAEYDELLARVGSSV